MFAAVFHEYGGPEVLRYEETGDPVPGPGQVVLEIKAAALNHLDVFVRRGIPGSRLKLPHITGADAAGVVGELGVGVTHLKQGDRVLLHPGIHCGRCEFCLHGEESLCKNYHIVGESIPGTYAEKLVVPADHLLPIPDDLDFTRAACLPLTLQTAWRMMVSRGKIQPGEDVLVLAAGSGVGVMVIQIAKLYGCRVFAAASTPEKRRRCEELGADITLGYENFDKVIRNTTGKRGVDVVVDTVGTTTWEQSIKTLRSGGRLLTCGATSGPMAQTDLRHVFFRQLSLIGSTMGTRGDLSDGLQMCKLGKIRPVLDSVLPLRDVARAHRRLEDRDVFGKIVLTP